MKSIALLKNPVQTYAWGSKSFIPDLLGKPSPVQQPEAELWMGAHPRAPSLVLLDGEEVPLFELIRKNPIDILGRNVAKRFSNRLPFLLKVLAASKPLSIQAHPNRTQARDGFERENRLKIPLDAPHRNYRDDNHKPEILCALSPFSALKGFRPIEDMLVLWSNMRLSSVSGLLENFKKQPDSTGLETFFRALMTMDSSHRDLLVGETLAYCESRGRRKPVFEWVLRLNQAFPGDIGVLSPLLLNLVRLQPGEAMFVPAGTLHAYLDGAGIELMSNSDNVLRGGLTPKHIDVQELVNILDFTGSNVNILRTEGADDIERFYDTPTDEFLLSVIQTEKSAVRESPAHRNVELMICTRGEAQITDLGAGKVSKLDKGTAIIVPAALERYSIVGDATLYKATVPDREF